MGCTSSKLDDLPAVALCRDRCRFLDEAIRQRYAFADTHMAYIQSLRGIGLSLDRCLGQDLGESVFMPSPVLHLPTQRKGGPVVGALGSPPPGDVGGHLSHSNSGSHLHLHSDSEDEDGHSGSLHDSGNSSPLHHHGIHPDYNHHLDQEAMGSFPGEYMTMNYMRKQPTPAVTYEQRPVNPEAVQVGGSSYFSYASPNQNPSPYPYYAYPNYGGGTNDFIGSTPIQYGSSSSLPPMADPSSASSSKPPPPPPSPPRSSAWDFLNPFEMFQSYYPPHTPSRDSKEVREEEGIPDLEDEEYREVVKEVDGDQKFVDGGGNYSKKVADEDEGGNDREATLYQTRPSVSVEKGVGVDNNVVANEKRSGDRGNVDAFKARVHFQGASEVVTEIRAQFERASEAGNDISKLLEAGKLPYHKKHAVYQVSSKMLHVITPSSVVSSHPSTSKSTESSSSAEKASSVCLGFDEDMGMKLTTLSSTLQKLYIWEKKLYDEVKAEEKMRIMHEKKSRRLKRLDEKGAEAHQIDSTRTLVRTLSTKIGIAIQVVDKISIKINKLRDEELWPQINELIHGLLGMWKMMLECHRNQCQVLTEAKNLNGIEFNRKFSTAHLEAMMQLEDELLNWVLSFSSWIGAQKGYVTALNSWLRQCLFYEPEETPDGIVPFSPGRMGAPPVFVICHQWSQAMERISVKEVVDAMLGFAMILRQNIVSCQRVIANGDTERKVKALEKEEQKRQKAIQVLDKKLVLVSGQASGLLIPGQSDISNISMLHSGLKQIFDAMERFTANSMQVYEGVCTEEERLARENLEDP